MIYRNTKIGLVLKPPPGWQADEQVGPAIFTLAFFAPQEDPREPYRENVVLIVQPLFAPATVDEYMAFYLLPMRRPPLQFEMPSRAKFADLPARKVSYTGPLNPMMPLPSKCFLLWAVSDTKGYSLCYAARAEKFDQHFQAIQELIDSVVIV